MNGNLQPLRLRFRWARIHAELPPGIHKPKHPGDCGWDLAAMHRRWLNPGRALDIPINVRIELPEGYWASMRARSSVAKRGLQVDAGTIDNGYRGPLFVVCRNVSAHPVELKAGERIAQLVFHRLHELWDEEVEQIDVDATMRGEAGFGSTGIL